MIPALEPPDSHHLVAAEGWLELGNAGEAGAELKHIAPEWAEHPVVLELDWQIHAHVKDWEACLELARRLVRLHPDLPMGWIHRSYALHELKRTLEARDLLSPLVQRFPEEPVMVYNLACYECRLGNWGLARRWLRQTFAMKNSAPWRQAAQSDPDLAPLWREIPQL
jgi:predicted Zn-dependent protease